MGWQFHKQMDATGKEDAQEAEHVFSVFPSLLQTWTAGLFGNSALTPKKK